MRPPGESPACKAVFNSMIADFVSPLAMYSRADAASAARASPTVLAAAASGASSAVFSTAANASLLALAFGPSSHWMGSASSAVLACHQVSATTATALSLTRSTCFTPGRRATAAASKPFSLPPKTGHSLMAAFSRPGSFRSMP